MNNQVKILYTQCHDRIVDKRYNSPYWLRRYTHRQIYAQFLPFLRPGQRVLDAGCGEGVLSCLAAKQGVEITGTDISAPNIRGAQQLAVEWDVDVTFIQSDAEHLPFPDNSFDMVLSSHVLEHLPNYFQGLRELYRVTRALALIAMPTCLNPACWSLLGGGGYYVLRRRSLVALPLGLAKTVLAFLRGERGPDEGYGGNQELPHIWRFPWVMRSEIKSVGFDIESFEAGPLILPYLGQYIPAMRRLQPIIDQWRDRPFLRNLGYGSLAVCRKREAER
jgi:2-polyprenyl-3-methyl-5-hydroxy-6-metoxy-1,4-benzoquinol methylase